MNLDETMTRREIARLNVRDLQYPLRIAHFIETTARICQFLQAAVH
jgi:hypothetical protein